MKKVLFKKPQYHYADKKDSTTRVNLKPADLDL